MIILFGDNHVQNSCNWKKGGGMPRNTNLVLKKIVDQFPPKNVTVILCFSWMAPRKNEIVKESYNTLILCRFFICEIKKN